MGNISAALASPGNSNFKERCEEAYKLVDNFINDKSVDSFKYGSEYEFDKDRRKRTQKAVLKSLEVLEGIFQRQKLKDIAISYNGGKDCLVMLVLILSAIYTTFFKDRELDRDLKCHENHKLDSIYVSQELPFQELSDFIERSAKHYHLNQVVIRASLRDGFEQYLTSINPEIKCIIVGIRYTDPYGSLLKYEQMTDGNWPRFLRIHPILHWKYDEIWEFLLSSGLEYCKMYDDGYTSLGGSANTERNPYLQKKGSDEYYPAYMLTDNADMKERSGRR